SPTLLAGGVHVHARELADERDDLFRNHVTALHVAGADNRWGDGMQGGLVSSTSSHPHHRTCPGRSIRYDCGVSGAIRIEPIGARPMVRYVALLQGINVGKTKRVAMSDLKALVEKLGYTDVRTHLNSGNVVFTSPEKRANDEIADAIEA